VNDELAQPRLEPVRLAQGRKLPPRREQRALHRVLSEIGVPQNACRNGEHPVGRHPDEGRERVPVALHRPLDHVSHAPSS